MNSKFLSPLESFDFSHPYSQFLASVAASQTAQIALSEALRPNLEMKKRLEAILPEQTHYLQSHMPALAELQNRLSQLTEQEFQARFESYEPSDKLVDVVNNALEKSNNLESKQSYRFLSKKDVKKNLIAILLFVIKAVASAGITHAVNATFNSGHDCNSTELQQQQLVATEKQNELLQDFNNVIHIFIEETDIISD